MRAFIYGQSPPMQELRRKIGQILCTPVPVLIEGETGTGKEALARLIHATGAPGESFAHFACAAGKPLELREDARGWIFLKSVNRLEVATQEQLLTGIDRGSGEGTWQRIISSSSQPLDQLVAQGRFLAALYHRLAGVRVRIAPLRERAGDIVDLFQAFVEEYASATTMAPPMLSKELRRALESYSWPGNGRELSNFATIFAVSGNSAEMAEELGRRVESARPETQMRVPLKEQVRRASRELESGIILSTLQSHRWNRRRAAETLNISYRSLLYKMKACNLGGENAGRGGL